MHAFYDSRMTVPVSAGSTPSHMKPAQLHETLMDTDLPIVWQPVTPVAWDDLEAIHEAWYVAAVRTGEPESVAEEASVTWTPELAESLLWETGSMVNASLAALETGCAVSLSSGFHHAHYDRSGTFCLINGLVLAALRVIEAVPGVPVLILDCDYHYGNGTDDILGRFIERPDVDIRHESLGRRYKKPHQADEYVAEMAKITKRITAGEYGFVIYQAGMDVLVGDPLGGLLSYRQTYERDRAVFEACHESNTPIAWNLAGGYKKDDDGTIAPVLEGHVNTCIAAVDVFDGFSGAEP